MLWHKTLKPVRDAEFGTSLFKRCVRWILALNISYLQIKKRPLLNKLLTFARQIHKNCERTEQQRQKAIEDEKNYQKAKGIFFGLVFSDSLICIKVIESVKEMEEEGRIMHHCVGGYHNKANSLILSATIDGKRIETIEVSLKTLKVVQSRGVCNSNTEYHDRIIRLVEDNAGLIRQRMNAA